MKVVATVFWIYLVTTTTGQKSCEEWKKFEEYCYMRSCTDSSFSDAQAYCTDQGGDLTSISTEGEFLHIASILQDTTQVKAWVGLRRRYNQWKWTDGTWLDTTEFTDNYLDKWAEKGNCVYMRTTPSGRKKLFGESCNELLNFVCRKRGGC
ncbi:lectin C-type domain protein [Ancylostoma duodenale]|uniref:Lectin C-type domain protein n=1 Tax=Ancylostoma duodenale TaxID=51022 RepID=A0A0C2FPV8_9BILA|nr:lectin C-type domain protein [Ancylostoma duodenale]